MFSKRQVLVLDSAKPSVRLHVCQFLLVSEICFQMSIFHRHSPSRQEEINALTRRVKHSLDGATDAGGRALDDERVAVRGDQGDVWAFVGHVGATLVREWKWFGYMFQ